MIKYQQCNCPVGARLLQHAVGSLVQPQEIFAEEVTVFPNPAKSQLTIGMYNSDHPIQLVLRNAAGQEMVHKIFVRETIIDVSRYPKGVYLIHLQDLYSTNKTVKKVLIQK